MENGILMFSFSMCDILKEEHVKLFSKKKKKLNYMGQNKEKQIKKGKEKQ